VYFIFCVPGFGTGDWKEAGNLCRLFEVPKILHAAWKRVAVMRNCRWVAVVTGYMYVERERERRRNTEEVWPTTIHTCDDEL